MEKGLVSIITPMYKGAAFVGEAIACTDADVCKLGNDNSG